MGKMCKDFIRENVLRENWEGVGKGLESFTLRCSSDNSRGEREGRKFIGSPYTAVLNKQGLARVLGNPGAKAALRGTACAPERSWF